MALQVQLVGDAIAAIVLLLAATTLSVYKPWGMTKYGRRKQQERGRPQVEPSVTAPRISPVSEPITPRWLYIVGIHAIGLVLLFVVLHLTGRGLPGH